MAARRWSRLALAAWVCVPCGRVGGERSAGQLFHACCESFRIKPRCSGVRARRVGDFRVPQPNRQSSLGSRRGKPESANDVGWSIVVTFLSQDLLHTARTDLIATLVSVEDAGQAELMNAVSLSVVCGRARARLPRVIVGTGRSRLLECRLRKLWNCAPTTGGVDMVLSTASKRSCDSWIGRSQQWGS